MNGKCWNWGVTISLRNFYDFEQCDLALEINVVSYHGLAVWPQENVTSASSKRNGRHIHQKRVATTTSLNAEHISQSLQSADSIWGPNCIICWVDILVLDSKRATSTTIILATTTIYTYIWPWSSALYYDQHYQSRFNINNCENWKAY